MKYFASVNVTTEKLFSGVYNTTDKFFTGVIDTGDKTVLAYTAKLKISKNLISKCKGHSINFFTKFAPQNFSLLSPESPLINIHM
jgi:hypothetical protein